jgi:outer membrane protein
MTIKQAGFGKTARSTRVKSGIGWVLAGILLTALGASRASAQPPVPLTLSEAVARTVQTSHRLAESLARQEAAEAAIEVREAADRPTLAVSGGYTRTNHVDVFAVPVLGGGGIQVIYPDIPDNYFTRATLQWPIYSGGRTDALQRAAAAEARATVEDTAVARADLRLEVVRSYWALATATESVRVLEEAVARADVHLRDVRARFDAGFIPPNEVSSAEAQRSRQQIQLIEARNFRGSIVEDLGRLTGITGDIVVADRLEEPASPASDDRPAVVDRAEQRALAERISATEDQVRAIEAGRRPTLSFTGAADYANPNPRIFPREGTWRTSWELGVVASWNLWDGGRIAAEAAQAAASARALRERRADLDMVIATDVRQRQLDLDSARASLAAADEGVRSAADARRVLAERFDVGVATNTEVLDAQLALLQAELDRTRTLANIRLAEARLDRALGR